MPDTICRKCGTELDTKTKCVECYQTTREICPNCKYSPLEKFHFNCMLISGTPRCIGMRIQEAMAA